MEHEHTVVAAGEAAVEGQRVKVHVEPQVAAEALDRRDRAAPRAAHAFAPQEASHAAKDLAQEQAKHLAQQRWIARAQEA